MKYFIDTHDKTKGSFPKEELTEQQFFDNFDALDKAAGQFGAFGHAAHVSLKEGKAFCCQGPTRIPYARPTRRSTAVPARRPLGGHVRGRHKVPEPP